MARSWEVHLATYVRFLEVAGMVSSSQGYLAPQLSFWAAVLGAEEAEVEVLALALAEMENIPF